MSARTGGRLPRVPASRPVRGAAGLARLVIAAAVAGGVSPATGQTTDWGVETELTTRLFPRAPLFGDQTSARLSPSLAFAPELVVDWGGGLWRAVGEAFLRLDAHDDGRTHFDVRELGVRYMGRRASVFAGVGRVFWGVTEVRHLVDVVNQTDAVEDLDGEDKLGQPMVSLTLEGDAGAVDFFLLPYARERTYPSGDARLRGPAPVAAAGVHTWHGRWSPGFAARAFTTRGSLDLALSFFRGPSREPRLVAGAGPEGGVVLTPYYDLIDQVGLEAQWTGDAMLAKLEAITRGGQGGRFGAVTAGIEYTLYQVGGQSDFGLLAEVMLDSRGDDAPLTIFDNDVFLGARWALNDAASTSALGGPMVDLDTGEVVFFAEAERRLDARWSLDVQARMFGNVGAESLLGGFRNDGYVSVNLRRFF